jgi:uncharacterized damage-inducible protein DinB
MYMENHAGTRFIKELEAESFASRKCIERIPDELYSWKPHERSMEMGYLVLLVADIPRWITYITEIGEIDFATYDHYKLTTTAELVSHYDNNIRRAKTSLQNLTDEILSRNFTLKNRGEILFSSPVDESISSTLNHWVHHRGQLTVYMRLNNIPVPSIYGPSADDAGY